MGLGFFGVAIQLQQYSIPIINPIWAWNRTTQHRPHQLQQCLRFCSKSSSCNFCSNSCLGKWCKWRVSCGTVSDAKVIIAQSPVFGVSQHGKSEQKCLSKSFCPAKSANTNYMTKEVEYCEMISRSCNTCTRRKAMFG